MKTTNIILDCNNLLHRSFHMNKNEPDDIIVGSCHFDALQTMNVHYNTHKAKSDRINVIAVFDGERSWRKIYTKDLSKCVTHKKYKGLRRNDMTPKEKARMEIFEEHIKEFEEILHNHTNVITLKHKFLEADDLIAGFVQHDNFVNDNNIIVSADRDFMQLLKSDNVTLMNPATNKPRTLEDYHFSSDYFIFEKCFRGESGKTSDNVQSAYPRLYKTKIEKAFKDSALRENLMEHTFEVEDMDGAENIVVHKYRTRDLFEENQLLMDLSMQPSHIRELMDATIEENYPKDKTFNKLKFLRYCSRNGMDAIVENGSYLMKMLSN